MQITIDNGDGLGAVDYTSSVAAKGRVRLVRKLNAPSECIAEVVLGVNGLAVPQRSARVVANSDDGTVLFTGYLVTEPTQIYTGSDSTGSVYRARLSAVSDEWLLNKQGSGSGNTLIGLDGRRLLETLIARTQAAGSLTVSSGPAVATVSAFDATPGASWSENASAAVGAAYAGYRAIAGEVLLQPAGTVTHTLSDADGTLDVHAFQVSALRELANDVTLSGAEEPTAYISENFLGDGSTTSFELSAPAFRLPHRTLIDDTFSQASINTQTWAASDPGSHLSLTSAGLTMNGGNGFDGQTTLTAVDDVEMGGTIVAELGSVALAAASDGMLGGMYEGGPTLADCFAGFRVRQSVSGTGGVTVLVPVLNGAEVGATFTPVAGHFYTLRLRLQCAEMFRVAQEYRCMVDGAVESFGNPGGIDAAMNVVFELVDQGNASNTPATVLYDSASVGAVTATPAKCSFVAVNSTQLFGSVGKVMLTQPGSMWIVSTLPSGTQQTRLIGTAGEGVDCIVDYGTSATSGEITFVAGRVPVAGERVSVFYRGQQRSVARSSNPASIAAEAIGENSGVNRWLGKVLHPAARSSVDCESAVEAVLAMATSRSAALSGTYAAINPAADIWPGDVLQVTSDGVASALLTRSVTIEDGGTAPEVLQYTIAFANDWATELEDGLGVALSNTIAADALLPETATPAGNVLANLDLTVTGLNSTTLSLDAGMTAPTSGGFEVRRRDWAFSPRNDVDLVLRSPVRGFSIPRAAQVEQFFVRMYDASTPPLYSRFSSAVFVNVPVD